MTVFFECTYDLARHAGPGIPDANAPLRLHRLHEEDDLAALLAGAADEKERVAALTALLADRPAVEVPAEARHLVHVRPPLLPAHIGDALVSGFMMTHNVKIDADTQDQPNWFVKGLGDILRVPGEPLSVPADAVAACEEAEIVLVYVGDAQGIPRYAGHTFGNDLTDIGRFKRHAGHLSYAKLCDAGIAPWLHLGPPPRTATGEVVIERAGGQAWKGPFTTGSDAIHYDVAAMMDRLFAHRSLHRPGRVHYVYIGADRSSFHGDFRTADGDRVTIDVTSHGVRFQHRLAWAEPAAGHGGQEWGQ